MQVRARGGLGRDGLPSWIPDTDTGLGAVPKALSTVFSRSSLLTPRTIETAAPVDVDAVGLAIMSGAHNVLFPAVIQALAAAGADDVVVFGGGVIPDEDIPGLEAHGVKKVFKPGATLGEIADWALAHVRPRGL